MTRHALLFVCLSGCGLEVKDYAERTHVCAQLDDSVTQEVTVLRITVEPAGTDRTIDVAGNFDNAREVGFDLVWEDEPAAGTINVTLVASGTGTVAETCGSWDAQAPPISPNNTFVGMCLRAPPNATCGTPAICSSPFSCPFSQ
jgi:hypothetical protein